MPEPEEITAELPATENASDDSAAEQPAEEPASDGQPDQLASKVAAVEDGGTEELSDEQSPGSKRKILGQTIIIGAVFVIGFVIFAVIAIQVWEYSNSVSFCANACHDVHPEEIHAFQDSYHANVKCTECHMGRVGTINSMILKAGHIQHLPAVIFDNYERPLESASMRPANESCELCHWPPAFHSDTVRDITRFQPDEENTRQDTYLLMKTGAGTGEGELAHGIHWHITNPVEYIATDEHKQDVRWVGATLPDGQAIEYNDVSNPLSPEEIASAEKHVMDCVDCHNRVGHPFPPPEDLTDASLADGHLSQDLPYAKREMNNLLSATYDSHDQAVAAVGQVRERYEGEYPDLAGDMAGEIEAADLLAQSLLDRLVFDEPGINWQDFPDNGKHKDFPGCFRCHDGKHTSDDGEIIRLQCNLCHSVPVTVEPGDAPPEVPIASVQEPASHLESNFMADHRFQASDECAECHGEIQFGSDDSSFCSNSACHGTSWPLVDLDAAFEHPIELEGKHAEAWCHDCHAGVLKPDYDCANCHQPRTEPHFGEDCEECHSPAGFRDADMGDFEHPFPLEGAHAEAGCSDCHTAGATLTYDCAACHQPPDGDHFGDDCAGCHTPEGFGNAKLPPDAHPIPLEGAHQTAACSGCHAEGEPAPEYVCSNCHQAPDGHLEGECDACHTPEGFVQSAELIVSLAPALPHEVAGREDCLMCHDPEGKIKPAPASHADYSNEQCTLCHKAAP